MYQMDACVRYSEVDENKRIKLVAILDYFQDCCAFQSESLGVGVDYLKEHHVCWILNSWQIVVERYPALGEKLVIATWPYEFKGFFGYRNLTMTDENGKVVAYANSTWTFLDTETGRPVRIFEEVLDAYELSAPYPMECASRKLALPESGKIYEPIGVHRFFIDTNSHVNNGKYVLIAEEFLPEDFQVKELRVEYRKAAVLGNVMVPVVEEKEDKIAVMLADEDKKPYAIVEFFGGKK